MLLRNTADIRTLFFMAITTGLLVLNWSLDQFHWVPFLAACFMAVSVTTMAHNHNHLQMWKHKTLNVLQDYWLTLFYGFPVFVWIPTHNKNHHRYNNREGDHTLTYRVSESNNLLTLLSYPTISSFFQQGAIKDYMATMWKKRKSRFFYGFSQFVLLAAFVGVALWIDWQKALLYIVIPQQVGLFSVLMFNYLQHVHADEESEWNHSRNFVGKVLNFFLHNNGYHTIHHESPGLHWSELPEAHEEIADKIDDRLIERSFWWFMFRQYILGIFFPSLRTKSMRLERLEREQQEASGDGPVASPA
ncbi:MAG: fatty acid desaturase family protein [Persicimonas sp.]